MSDEKPDVNASDQDLVVMRYFFVVYLAESSTRRATGNLYFEASKFPSNKEIKELARDKKDVCDMSIVVTGWQEFKNKEDYDNFRSA